MRFGLGVATCREGNPYPIGFATPAMLRDTATFAEANGFYSLWADDHLVTTPLRARGLLAAPNYYEPLITYAHLAAVTQRLKLMTATIVPSMRDPVLFAKQVIALDQLSGGRLILGIGLGAFRDEFEAVAANPKADRGKMMEEFIEATRQLLDTQKGPFAGKYYRFGELTIAPAPLRRPYPIYLSGQIPEALERIGRVASGWIVSSIPPEQIRERWQTVSEGAIRAGRDPKDVEVCLFTHIGVGVTEAAAIAAWEGSQSNVRTTRPTNGATAEKKPEPGGQRVHLLGSPEQVAEQLRAYEQAGVQHVGLVFRAQTREEFFERVSLFAREVMPSFV